MPRATLANARSTRTRRDHEPDHAGQETQPNTDRVISLDVTDPDGEGRLHLGQVYARDRLPIDPCNRVTMSKAARWSHLKGLPLLHAPVDEVMLLIGQDYPDALVPLATVPGGKGEPYAVKTRLGWTVNRPVNASETRGEQQAFFAQGERYERHNRQLEKLWKLESRGLYDDNRAMPVQDKLVTARWEKAATYEDGHHTLPIPFRHEEPRLPDDRRMTELRLGSLRRKLDKNPELSEKIQIEQRVFFTQREWYEQLDQNQERFRELESGGPVRGQPSDACTGQLANCEVGRDGRI